MDGLVGCCCSQAVQHIDMKVDRAVYLFLIPFLLGLALVGASVFTAAYSRRWGDRAGALSSSILRNLLGIPLWLFGFVIAWNQPVPLLWTSGTATKTLSWLLIITGSVPFIWGHFVIGKPSHMPSVGDKLVRHSLYAYVRHPIYAGAFLIVLGIALLKATSTVALACALGFVWLMVQARLEEIDLLQRLPEYRQYMDEVPRFIPRLRGVKANLGSDTKKASS